MVIARSCSGEPPCRPPRGVGRTSSRALFMAARAGNALEHVGDLLEQPRALAVEVGGRHAQVAHAGRGVP